MSRLCVQARSSISTHRRRDVASIDDRADGSVDGASAVVVEVVVACGCRQEQQCLAEGVELELLVDPVADQVVAAGVAG